ncbi:MAG TPA: hypothetical protein VF575_01190 [Candidatus Saccharimonadales bacterium]|jgi:hypothetical protein
MKLKCIKNNINDLSVKLRKFAFTQDQNGNLEITIDKEYTSYGVRINDLGKFYFIVTDDSELPWWMPSEVFEVIDSETPINWKTEQFEEYGKETIQASSLYFGHEEDIEDGTEEGWKVFQNMKSEPEK